MPICESNDVFLVYTRAQNSLIFAKQKGSHREAARRTRGGSPEPRTRSIDRCAAADAAAVAAEAASRQARGLPTRAMASDDEPKEHKHHKHKRKPV